MVKKITSGQVVERRKSYVGRKPSRRGARIKGNSGEKKQENNRQQAVLALARLLNCNYTHGDALLTLTFIDEALERCGGTFEGAVKEAKNFLDRIARRWKKHGVSSSGCWCPARWTARPAKRCACTATS